MNRYDDGGLKDRAKPGGKSSGRVRNFASSVVPIIFDSENQGKQMILLPSNYESNPDLIDVDWLPIDKPDIFLFTDSNVMHIGARGGPCNVYDNERGGLRYDPPRILWLFPNMRPEKIGGSIQLITTFEAEQRGWIRPIRARKPSSLSTSSTALSNRNRGDRGIVPMPGEEVKDRLTGRAIGIN